MKQSKVIAALAGIVASATIAVAALLPMTKTPAAPAAQSPVKTVGQTNSPTNVKAYKKSGEKAWVDSVYNTLTERQRVAQLFCPRLDATDTPAWRARIKRLVETDGIGGILLGKGTIKSYKTLIDYSQSLASVPLLVTLDGEWGLSMRLKDAIKYPVTMGLGAISEPDLLREYGLETARQCRLLGINVNFAPVMDVNSNPANPVIGTRSFGEDPERVAAAGTAYAQGLEEGGVLSVAKHFPGHGDTSTDSHKTYTTVSHSAGTLNDVDLLPFKRYIDCGFSGVMVGHLKVPALDKSGTPASLSKEITGKLLKDKMGFEGLVFTDALAMKGAATPGQNNCIAAVNAGADILLGSATPEKDIQAVYNAVKQGKIKESTLEAAVKKILAYKWRLANIPAADATAATAGNSIEQAVNSPEADAMNHRLAAAMMTVVRNEENLLPIKNVNQKIAVVSLGTDGDNEFVRYCRKYAPVIEIACPNGAITEAQLKKIGDAKIVIAGVFGSSTAIRHSFSRISTHSGFIPVFFTNPYDLSKFIPAVTSCRTLVLAYDNTPATRRAAPQALFGGIKVNGRVPVNVKGALTLGDGVTLEKTRLGYTTAAAAGFPTLQSTIDSIAKVNLDAKSIPGCQVLIAKGGDVIVDSNYGYTDFVNHIPVSDETIYDLASVSKATGTLSGIMEAYDRGLFNLDDRASKYIPGLVGTDKEDITVRQLLYHETGIKPSLNMYDVAMDSTTYVRPLMKSKRDATYNVKIQDGLWGQGSARLRSDIVSSTPGHGFNTAIGKNLYVNSAAYDTIMANIYRSPLSPTKAYNYSCLNFCLLMDMEQRLTGTSHDKWVEENVFGPLGAYHTGYRPTEWYSLNNIAPTEADKYLRRQTIHGHVHDELAAFSGGLQGNAGLFGNADDLAKLMQMWLNGGTYGGEKLLSDSTVNLFTTTVSPTCRRGLGYDMWDIRDDGTTLPGCPAETYGHTGFTGTVFWVDPVNDIIFIFLCNRVNPTRDNKEFSRLNPRRVMLTALYDIVNATPASPR